MFWTRLHRKHRCRVTGHGSSACAFCELYLGAWIEHRVRGAGCVVRDGLFGCVSLKRMSDRAEELRRRILELTAQYHAAKFPVREFVPGESVVPVSGKVIGAEDICSVVDSALDGWFTTGRFAREFERRLAKFVGVRSAQPGELRIEREPGGAQRADLAQAGRAPVEAGRRGADGCGGISHHGEPDLPEPAGAGVCGCHAAHLRDRCDQAGGRVQPEDEGGDDCAHAGQCLRPGCSIGLLQEA